MEGSKTPKWVVALIVLGLSCLACILGSLVVSGIAGTLFVRQSAERRDTEVRMQVERMRAEQEAAEREMRAHQEAARREVEAAELAARAARADAERAALEAAMRRDGGAARRPTRDPLGGLEDL